MARGFDIKNTPHRRRRLAERLGIVTGADDSLGYEKIEYETNRIEADHSTPFSESGSWARVGQMCGRRSGAG